MCNMIAEYDCKENDNTIKVFEREDEAGMLGEIWVGCKDAESAGWTVIGGSDLENALNRAGFGISKLEVAVHD